MKILVPANVSEMGAKRQWFSKSVCQRAKGRGVEFGFEVKGPLTGLDTSLPFSVHLPNDFANLVQYDQAGGQFLATWTNQLIALNRKPLYVVMHGLKVKRADSLSSKKKQDRYTAEVGPKDYLAALEK